MSQLAEATVDMKQLFTAVHAELLDNDGEAAVVDALNVLALQAQSGWTCRWRASWVSRPAAGSVPA